MMQHSATSDYPELFSPFHLNGLVLRNRIVAPPMLQIRPITSAEGIAWYRRLAAGGAAMVTVEVTSILRFGTELTADNLRPLVKAIHDQGAAAAIQLFPIQFRAEVDPNTLTAAQIDDILQRYAATALICRDAGFDAVEPHGAHGYLINQFFMPDRNRRTDEYGGTLDNRCRFGVRIVQSIRRAVGNDYLLFYRHTPTGKAYGVEDSLELARRLVDAGANLLDISPAKQQIEADLAAPFKQHFKVPVIAVNGMEDPDAATRACAMAAAIWWPSAGRSSPTPSFRARSRRAIPSASSPASSAIRGALETSASRRRYIVRSGKQTKSRRIWRDFTFGGVP